MRHCWKDKHHQDLAVAQKSNLKKDNEGLIMTAQEQHKKKHAIKAKVERITTNSKCHLCKESDETLDCLITLVAN